MVWFVSGLSGLPGVGWFLPLWAFSSLCPIRSVCLSAMSVVGGVGGVSGLSRFGLGSGVNRASRALLAYTAIGAIAAIRPYRAGAECVRFARFAPVYLVNGHSGANRAENLYKRHFGHNGQRACIGVGHRQGWCHGSTGEPE